MPYLLVTTHIRLEAGPCIGGQNVNTPMISVSFSICIIVLNLQSLKILMMISATRRYVSKTSVPMSFRELLSAPPRHPETENEKPFLAKFGVNTAEAHRQIDGQRTDLPTFGLLSIYLSWSLDP